MILPAALAQKRHTTILDYEEEHKMPFMIYPERKGYEKGMLEGIREGKIEGIREGQLKTMRENITEILMIRFGDLSDALVETVNRLDEHALLKRLHKQAVAIESLSLFEAFMAEEVEAYTLV